MRCDSHSAVTVSYNNWLLLLSSIRWMAPGLVVERSSSVRKRMMSVQIRLKMKRTTAEILKAVSAASAVSTKEESNMDELEPAAHPTLSEEESTAMKKPLDLRVPVCCIYDVDLKTLVEEYLPCFRKDVSGKVDFVFVDRLCNVQRARYAEIS